MLNVSTKKVLFSAVLFSLCFSFSMPVFATKKPDEQSDRKKKPAAVKKKTKNKGRNNKSKDSKQDLDALFRMIDDRSVLASDIPDSNKQPPAQVAALKKKSNKQRRAELGMYIPRNQRQINNCVAKSAEEAFAKMNKWKYAAPTEKLTIQSQLWEARYIDGIVCTGGEKQNRLAPSLIYKGDPDQLFEALDDLLAKPAAIECTVALQIAKLCCLKELLGKRHFNTYSSKFYSYLKSSEKKGKKGVTLEEFARELPLQFLKRKEGEEHFPGSIGYITNIPSYGDFKPDGNGRGINVFCINGGRYSCFDPGYAPLTLREWEDTYFEVFTRDTDVTQHHEKHKEICEIFKRNPDLYHEIRRKEQSENCTFVEVFDEAEIHDYVRTGDVLAYE